MDDSGFQADKTPEVIKPAVQLLKVLGYSGLVVMGAGAFYVTHVLYPFFYDVAEKPRNKLRIKAIAWGLNIAETAMILGGLYGLATEFFPREDETQNELIHAMSGG